MQIARHFVSELTFRLREKLGFIQAVIGPRQVGKTTGVKSVIESWTGPKLYVTADEVISPGAEWLEMHWKRARSLGENTLFAIDEIQKVTNWDQIVKKYYDEDRNAKRLNVVVLGSASLAIQQGLSESLAGRYEILRATHWSYKECREAFTYSLSDYLKYGGYPALAPLRYNTERFQTFVRESILEPVLGRDILSIATVSKPALFRQTFELAMHYPAQELSLQKMLGQLQDRGNVTTIKHYLQLLEGAYLLKLLHKFSIAPITTKASSPKILPLNIALVHAFTDPDEVDSNSEWRGHVVETAVGSHLLSQGELWYWRDAKHEVDFVLQHKKTTYAIEVKSGRRRLGDGLQRFVAKFAGSIPVVIDRDNLDEFLSSPNGVDYIVKHFGNANLKH